VITNNKYNVVLELEPEDVLVLTTLIATFRDTLKALDVEVPVEMRARIINILQKLTAELHEVLGEDN